MGLATQLRLDAVIGEDFKIVRRLGEGGMGVVFAAVQLTTGHERAVKVMHAPFAMDARARERFEQEARIGSRIHSDHVVQVVAAGIEERTHTPWLAMELLQGQDLERYIQTRGPMPFGEVALVISQIIHALAAAHDVGVVHRDIKPENIFLSVSRVVGVPFMVKVLDFGIAKLRSSARAATVSVGTPDYMAPEQTQASEDIGPAADLWPLGLVVFRMLTGSFFWRASAEDSGLPQLWREMLIDPIPTATERARQLGCAERLPPGFDEWFAACVDREPALRFNDARAAGRALDELFRRAGVSGLPGSGGPAQGLSTTLDELGPSSSQRRGTIAAWIGRAPYVTQPQASGRAPATPSGSASNPAANCVPTHRVSFHEHGERIVAMAEEGDSLLEVAIAAGVPHYHACGGNARCSTCRVVVLDGRDALSARTEAEDRIAARRKWPKTTRLACQAKVRGSCKVRRLVVDPTDASLADLRRPAQSGARAERATVLALRLEGIDDVLADGFPDDAIHGFERCMAQLEDLLGDNGGRMVGFESTTAIAAFPEGERGVRRALRVALRASARIRRLNTYLLKYFGVQVTTTAGLGSGLLLEGRASTASHTGAVVMGVAARQARHACDLAKQGQVLARPWLLAGQDLICSPGPVGLEVVIDFAKTDIVYLVQSSFDRLEGRAMAFAEAFYNELFARHPTAVPLFMNTDMDRQRKKLMNTLTLTVKGLDDFANIEGTVRELGRRHADLGASLTDYKAVGEALLSALERFLGEAFTPEVELAWREVYSNLVRTMTS
ncbi:Serine/threonine-protein kinase Pkn1 [Enhygromyxa salina]|uniref:Serine/threonine-protein kinase Pkn1 n=1 Tax=Enhygromyxa salina TaxID=215803 RepID=A0A2S9YDX8_9BACT|nr:protein kinase [Enhygromyxa salina]PRQ03328.1 Serine/threonine-protein kinase Pkn1 [Enhygromyxa salina]